MKKNTKNQKINKLALGKTNTHRKLKTKPKPAGPITYITSPVRTAHMCVLITEYNCGT